MATAVRRAAADPDRWLFRNWMSRLAVGPPISAKRLADGGDHQAGGLSQLAGSGPPEQQGSLHWTCAIVQR